MEQLHKKLDEAGIKYRELPNNTTRVLLDSFTHNLTVTYDIAKGKYRLKTNSLLLAITYSVLIFNSFHSYVYSYAFISVSLAIIAMLGFYALGLTEQRSRPVKAIIKALNSSDTAST